MKSLFWTIFLCGLLLKTTTSVTFEERKAELTKELNKDDGRIFGLSSRSRERFYPYRNPNNAYYYGYPYYYNPGFSMNPFRPPPPLPFPFNLFTTQPPPPFPFNLFYTTPPPFPFNLLGKK
jgi:hypothetical protein